MVEMKLILLNFLIIRFSQTQKTIKHDNEVCGSSQNYKHKKHTQFKRFKPKTFTPTRLRPYNLGFNKVSS